MIVVALIVLGFALRLWQIDNQSFWLDEAGRAAIASLPFGQIAHGVAVVELSPPLYHYVLAAWMNVAGDGDVSIRLLSALLAVPSVALGWSLGRAIAGPRVGLGLAGLIAVSPFAVHYGQEAAMYALLLPLGLGTIRAAVGVLTQGFGDRGWGLADEPPQSPLTPNPQSPTPARLRRARARWLLIYVVLGVLGLYTHYYAAFLLFTVALVGVGDSIARRSRHGAIIWSAAHLVILLAFVPWLPQLVSQAGLAASVEDWRGVAPTEALVGWSAALFADGAEPWESLALTVAVAGPLLGLWRLRDRGPIAWLLLGLVVVPLVLATLASGFFHSFRERGFIVVAAAPWLLTAAAVLGPSVQGYRPSWAQRPLSLVLGAAVALVTVAGLRFHYLELKEDWRGAAAIVAAQAGPEDPIFFVHFASEIPFDRYFHGPQPRIGLPESFDWEDGYHARYIVTQADVSRRVPPALAGAREAWAVLSHDGGRGSDRLITALAQWGVQTDPHPGLIIDRAPGPFVRVLRFEAKA